jgi:hypothetical protein
VSLVEYCSPTISHSLVNHKLSGYGRPNTIELVSEIANTLWISAGTGTFTIEPYASSLKVVAGARCHLYGTLFSWPATRTKGTF